jgi:hypothetical protein
MAQHPNLPSEGFPTSTIFTLGTENGIALVRVHTEADDLHLFVAFIRRNDFTVRLHWTNWEPGEEETVINHNGIDVPVDSEEPILSASIRHQRYYHRGPPFHFQPPTETESSGRPPIYTTGSEELRPEPQSPRHPTLFAVNPDTPSETTGEYHSPAIDTTGLHSSNEQPPETEEEEHDHSDTTSQYTEAGLLHREILIAIAEAENTES